MASQINKGVSCLKSVLNEFLDEVKSEGVNKISAILEISKNKFDDVIHDVKIKNIYYTFENSLCKFEKIKFSTIYHCLKLKQFREFIAVDYDGDKLSINEELTDKIVFRSKSGKFGNFNIAFIPVETSDYEEL